MKSFLTSTRPRSVVKTNLILTVCAVVAATTLTFAYYHCEAAKRPRYGGQAALAMGEPISALDPFQASLPPERALSSLVYETLFERSSRGPRPVLVKAWSANGDSTRWTLVLKDAVTFHDGLPLTAEDVIHSLRRVFDYPESHPYRRLLRELDGIVSGGETTSGEGPRDEAMEAGQVEDRTVILSFKTPEPDLPLLLSCPGLGVIPVSSSNSMSEDDSFLTPGPGTGPFRIESGGSPSRILLRAYEGHHDGRPFLDDIHWRLMSYEDASIELEAGSLDLYAGPPSPALSADGGFPGNARLQVIESSHLLYLACNPESGALERRADRMRVLSSVNRASILRSLIGRWGRIAHNLLPGAEAPSELWGAAGVHNMGAFPEAGVSDQVGVGMEPRGAGELGRLTLLAPRWHAPAGEVADRIQVDLLSAGYSVNVRKLGREEMSYKLASGEFDLYVGTWSPEHWLEDEGLLLAHFLWTQVRPAPDLASIVAREEAHPEPGGADHDHSILESLYKDAILLPLYHLDSVILTRPGLVTTEPGHDGMPSMAWSWLDVGRR